MNRRQFLATSSATVLSPLMVLHGAEPVELPAAHRKAVRLRRRRIAVQQDVHWVMMNYAKLHPEGTPPFAPFLEAVFSYVDEPGSQIDGIWWDIGGCASGAKYPSTVAPREAHPLVMQWQRTGLDWAGELVKETRRRKLEVFWNHRISEVDLAPDGSKANAPDPLKVQHPDWVLPTSWWPHGMWNLASEGLQAHKVAILRELAECYDLDGVQIDFSRHIPCLPLGRQWELRDQVTNFMRKVRLMLQEVAQKRGRPLLLAAKVPQTLAGCGVDGFDLAAWARQKLVDVLTLGSRTMDVDVEGIRASVGPEVQLQPCFDDHHATDGYRYAPSEYLRGIFANHWQRGADSVATFNWAIATPAVAKAMGGEVAPLTHQMAFKEIGSLQTMAGKDKSFAVERRGGYPWAEGFFNRNDTAPLPVALPEGGTVKQVLHISDAPAQGNALTLRCVLFQAAVDVALEILFQGMPLAVTTRDANWKDAQIFSPRKQPDSGGKGEYKVNPKQQLLRIECTVPNTVWKQGENEVLIRAVGQGAGIQLEKLEGLLSYAV